MALKFTDPGWLLNGSESYRSLWCSSGSESCRSVWLLNGSWSGSEIYRSGWVSNGFAPSDLYFAPSDLQSKFMTLGWPSDFQIYDPNPATLLGGSCCKHVRCNQLTTIWILKDRKFIGDFIRLTIQGPKVLIIVNFITNPPCSEHMNYFSALAAPTSTMPTTFGATLTRFLHALLLHPTLGVQQSPGPHGPMELDGSCR